MIASASCVELAMRGVTPQQRSHACRSSEYETNSTAERPEQARNLKSGEPKRIDVEEDEEGEGSGRAEEVERIGVDHAFSCSSCYFQPDRDIAGRDRARTQ